MYELALARQAELRAENDSLRALLRLRERQVCGTKSESNPTPSAALPQPKPEPPKAARPAAP